MTPGSWGEGDVLPRTGELRIEQLREIEQLIDVDVLAGWVERTCPGDFKDPQRWHEAGTEPVQRLAEQFVRVARIRKDKGDGENNTDALEELDSSEGGEPGEDIQ